ncbi:MAG: histidine kinase [Pseudomonadota bacterium]
MSKRSKKSAIPNPQSNTPYPALRTPQLDNPQSKVLRSRAEERLASKTTLSRETSSGETLHLIHELQVHQIELEMQNEELRRTQAELEESHTKYCDLYDFAPVGYLTLDRNGLILGANLTAAEQLGVARSVLIDKLFQLFIGTADRDMFHLHVREVFKSRKRQTCETIVRRKSDVDFCVQLESILVQDRHGNSVCRVSVIDVTERKAYEKQLQLREEERSRISQELQDGLGQVLAALKFDAAWLKSHLTDEKTDVAEHLQAMCDSIDDSFNMIRKMSTELRPGILDHLGLRAAVEWYASEFERRSGIECLTMIDLPGKRLAGCLETGIYRIVEEALSNTERHAKASSASISMKESGGTLFIRIADNGMGIEPTKMRSPFSTGISGMKERAKILSGTMEVNIGPGKGTVVDVRVPAVYRE